ncbi:MAG: heme o synthase [Cardiobacteriaceae bacterium]|nr:heme o synthase [Cardiobacteriaceae bacterium]
MLRDLVILAKPGIIGGNLLAAAAGYFLGAQGNIELSVLLSVLIGSSAVIASGCMFNNYFDRDIDQKMRRTRHRIGALQRTGYGTTLILASVEVILGLLVLWFGASLLAAGFGLLGFTVYVILYTLCYKRQSVHGTLIGSLSGACPPIIGYCAACGRFDMGALILLATFCFWQVPHSYAIAIYRYDDYRAANIPVLPLKDGIQQARKHIIAYIIAFAIAALMLALCGYTGIFYTLSMGSLSLYWLYLAKVGYQPSGAQRWAKKVFLFSLVTITAFSFLISIDNFVPKWPNTIIQAER